MVVDGAVVVAVVDVPAPATPSIVVSVDVEFVVVAIEKFKKS